MTRFFFISFLLLKISLLTAQNISNELIFHFTLNNTEDTLDHVNKIKALFSEGVETNAEFSKAPNSALKVSRKTIHINNTGGIYTLSGDSTISLSFWVKRQIRDASSPAEMCNVFSWGGFEIFDANGSFTINTFSRVENGMYGPRHSFKYERDDLWYHFAIVYNKGRWTYYINGKQVTEIAEEYLNQKLTHSESDIIIGGRWANFVVDDLRMYRGELDENSVAELYSIADELFNYNSQYIWIQEGWNIVSFYRSPQPKTVKDVLPYAITVKDFDKFYLLNSPEFLFLNSLTEIKAGETYLVNSYLEHILVADGPGLENTPQLKLSKGWNMCGLPSHKPFPLELMPPSVEIVKDLNSFYEKGNKNSNLWEMKPNKGYFIKSSSDIIVDLE